MNILGLITARGGSKRLPGKNIRSLCGKPLIAWTAEAAFKSRYVTRVMITTDDLEIASVSKKLGVEVPFMRPSALAQDSTPHMAVLEHVTGWLQESHDVLPDYILVLQPTSPLRTAGDIDAAVEIAVQKNADAVISVSEIQKNPTLLWTLADDGRLCEAVEQNPMYYAKQKPSQLLAPNGAIYLIRTEILVSAKTLYPRRSYPYVMPPQRSLDVDTLWDFQLAELILKNQTAFASAITSSEQR